MKKIIRFIACGLVVFITCCLMAPASVGAASQTQESRIISDYIEYLEDGSSFHIVIKETVDVSSRSTYTKSGEKSVTYRDADGVGNFTFTLYGSFQFIPGSSAACTSSSYSIDIYDANWENTTANAYALGNQAIGDATFNEKIFLVTTDIQDVHLTITCNAYGTLS